MNEIVIYCVYSFIVGEYTDGREDNSLEREGSMREESASRSFSRGSSARSTGPKSPTERPPAYNVSGSGAAGYMVEETITTTETSNVESAGADIAYNTRTRPVNALEVEYDDGEGKFDRTYA